MSMISNMDETIDSRDIIERIEELRDDKEALEEAINEAHCDLNDYMDEDASDPKVIEELTQKITDAERALVLWVDSPDWEELNILEELAKECQWASDWEHGETLIRDTYFVDYVKDMLEDCGTIPKGLPWYVAINWEETAENVQQDYTEVDYDGATYYIRSC